MPANGESSLKGGRRDAADLLYTSSNKCIDSQVQKILLYRHEYKWMQMYPGYVGGAKL